MKPSDQQIYKAWDVIGKAVQGAAEKLPLTTLQWLMEKADYGTAFKNDISEVYNRRSHAPGCKAFTHYTILDTNGGRRVIGRHYSKEAAERFVKRDGRRRAHWAGDATIEIIPRKHYLPADLAVGADLRGTLA